MEKKGIRKGKAVSLSRNNISYSSELNPSSLVYTKHLENNTKRHHFVVHTHPRPHRIIFKNKGGSRKKALHAILIISDLKSRVKISSYPLKNQNDTVSVPDFVVSSRTRITKIPEIIGANFKFSRERRI